MVHDLREFLEKLDKQNELKRIEGADWNLEIGAITEKNAGLKGEALLFDKINDYPEGYRVASNLFLTPKRLKIALGESQETPDKEIIKKWQQYLLARERPEHYFSPKTVSYGSVLENIHEGENINLFEFPAPKWHEFDGGRYIGTGVIVITKDPDTGFVNLGTYRVMIHDKRTLSFYVSSGKHADIHRRKYWERGESCPVVMCFGQDPLLFISSSLPLPYGASELDFCGYIRGTPVEVIEGKHTHLPIPANAEIAVEGFSPPDERQPEGLFGEWQGFYSFNVRNEPVVKVKSIYHRNNPIIHGNAPNFYDAAWYPIPIHSVPRIHDILQRNQLDYKDAWVHGRGNRQFVVISLEQKYPGHAQQVALTVASQYVGGAGTGRFVVTVDEDIDPANLQQVIERVCVVCNPEKAITVVPNILSSSLDLSIPPEKRNMNDYTTAKAIIDGCVPYHLKEAFPKKIYHSYGRTERD